jgi:cyclic beta-1,2-glucan synthetase
MWPKRREKNLIIKDINLNQDMLEEHGEEVSILYKTNKKSNVKKFLLNRLNRSFKIIEKVYLKFNGDISREKTLPKGAEWLLDNFYIIELTYKELKINLKKEEKIVLNTIEFGSLKGYPRVYALSLELVSHSIGNITEESLIRFVNAFQKEEALTLEEINYFSTFLTLGLMEYIGSISLNLLNINEAWEQIEKLNLAESLESILENIHNMDSIKIEKLVRKIRKYSDDFQPILEEINIKLNYIDTSIEQILEKEYRLQSKYKVSIGYGISSLRKISSFDWENVFNSICLVEKIFNNDPLDIYKNMDFGSKNYYRYETQILARRFKVQEIYIAKKVLEFAEDEWGKGNKDKRAHVGYYLIGEGREKLFKDFGHKVKNNSIYLGKYSYYCFPIILLGIFITFYFSWYGYNFGNAFLSIIIFIVIFIPAVTISINIINYLYSKKFKPKLLPKIEYKDGIPLNCATFVVIPTLLPSEERVVELIENLEVYFLSNKDKNIYFGIVGDFKDGDEKNTEEDKKIVDKGLEAIKELNNKYSKEEDIFYFFLRERVFSETQEKWMGWERKRGSLVEFNDLLLGEEKTNFHVISSDISKLREKIKYIITLDADTKLPIDGAKKLIGTISHPLNKAVIQEGTNTVVEGYGIIQPRIGIDIESSNKSLFTRIFAGAGGIDFYSTAISDIYQDLFGEGIFTGKGIYDLKVFQNCLKETIPENTVLSHDLLEGSYIRVGLATDIELIDGYPEKYSSYIMRQHRWVRGDWQLIKWLITDKRKSLSSLSKWKIVDNMRRSLLPVFLLLSLILGIVFFPGNSFVWIGITLITLLLPIITMVLEIILYKRFKIKKIKLNGNFILGYRAYLYQGILSLMFLPHEALMMLDAIIRTLYRVFISKKNLLEWTTAFDMEKKLANDISSYFKRMKGNIIISILLIALTYIIKPDNLIISGVIALLWLIGPIIAYIISKESRETIEIKEDDIELLRNIGKKTWEYYEQITDEKNNYLPPDNFQEYPYNGVANRTSPTNIGFYLMSVLSSRDLEFISTLEMVDLIDLTIGTIEKLEKWEGHLYNWYNTETLKPLKPIFVSTVDSGNLVSYLIVLKEGLKEYLNGEVNKNLILKIESLIGRINKLIDDTNFKPLYDEKRDLFYIGYNVEEKRALKSYYDLLASEARITSYIAISRKEVPLKHWQRLGKSLIMEKGYISLASWSGTMFEYLMPSLVLKNYKNTLLDETYKTSIKVQKDYGNLNNVPWGISESGFFAFDNQLNYQYKAFGVPALGFKRGLRDELVISPYSTFLALKFDPIGALSNIKRLKSNGLEGQYGFYEAVDYTISRLPAHLDKGIVKSYMSHHQGMIFASINNFLNNDILVDRFHRDPQMKCGELLLQEKLPLRPIISKEKENLEDKAIVKRREEVWKKRIYGIEDLSNIKCHLLSSSTYSLMITNRGEGFSKNEDIFVNRWRRDYLSSSYGQFIYIKNLKNNDFWSATYAPIYKKPHCYKVEFSNYKASFYRQDGDIETKMDIVLLPEELGEIRKVTLKNNSKEEVLLETISYFEVVGETLGADLSHPAFNNLFIRTEVLEDEEGLLAYRRKREEGTRENWIVHGIKVFSENEGKFQYETSRRNFIGRGNSLERPNGIVKGLTNTTGIVLDPIMSIGKKIKIEGGKKVDLYYITALSHSRQEAIDLLNKYNKIDNIKVAIDLSNTKSQTEIGYLNLNHSNISFYEELLPYLFYLNKNTKLQYYNILKQNQKGKEGLWAHGISGDNPIVLIIIKSMEGIENLIKLIDAHQYWSYKGLKVDLIILNEDKNIYYQPLFENIREVVYEKRVNVVDVNGGIFIRNGNTLPEEDKALLYKWAALVIKAEEGFIDKKIQTNPIPYIQFNEEIPEYPEKHITIDVDYFNGYGGFANKGKEYIIKLNKDLNTPLPWINVIGNRALGFIVSELGGGFTWSENSRENKLTPWYNDPINEKSGEIIYLRDNNTGEVWSITPKPIRDENDYIITHGLGYTSFYHYSQGIEQELTMFVSMEDKIKINLIRLKNNTNLERKISLAYYIRPVLGVTDEETENLLETDMNGEIFLVKNSTNREFKDTTLFIGTSEEIKSYTGDRVEFLGKVPNYKKPEGLKRERLSNTVGLGYNPCSVIEVEVSIPANGDKEIVFLLGEERNLEEGYSLINKYKNIEKSKETLEKVKEFWDRIISTIQIETPDDTMNFMMNNWLIYQTIVCRIWGRAGFYQVGGAYGARDQMQDATNILYHMPEEGKKQIIRNCKHQYKEGDIQHWWHPIPDKEVHKGIRSKYSDDLLWLPLGVAEYVLVTGKDEILQEKVPFIESSILKEAEYERYEVPSQSNDIGTVYEHCIRAIEKSLNFGEKGLPLMGSGDWNDGMNKVGYKGKGESVWLGWFLATVLKAFIPICEKMKDYERVQKYNDVILQLKQAIETNAWDGKWYKRAFFDDGTPIGSKESSECTIDSIAQSWSVISTLGEEKRSKIALESVENYLVNEEEGIVALLTPPFDDTELEPGYIKSYVPGVRENGGQYTHAAIWIIKAFAMLGQGDKAYNLFRLINPINHSRTLIECAKYKVEPYVVAADVYTNPQHLGRGGWTWYTGSSGWMYKVGLEDILGFRVEKDKLFINPSIPKDWGKYRIKYRYGKTYYNIEIKNLDNLNTGVNSIIVDGTLIKEEYVRLVDDGVEHSVTVKMGSQ